MPPPQFNHHRNWTLTTLIGSYIDLVLAYLLLIGSTISFFASKTLALFGLSLPCPCASSGLFSCCCPVLTTSFVGSIHYSIRTRFPFDLILNGSEPDDKTQISLPGPEGLESDERGNGKGVVIGRLVAAPVLRRIRRRRIVSISSRKGKALLDGPLRLGWQREGLPGNFEESSGAGLRIVEDRVSLVDEVAVATESVAVKDASFEIKDVHTSDGNVELITKNLEQELEEALAAHAAVYLELEKERSAAATATDEAMAMILRLQNEKAAVEMESRQYQRMIEEKSAYDEEEMEILKEIIVRREREKHVLEKEIEAYRQIMLSRQMTGDKPDSSFDSSADPTLMLKTICESIGKKEKVKDNMKWVDDGVGIHFLGFPDPGEECNIEFQEEDMVTKEIYPSVQCQSSSFGEDDIGYKLDGFQELGFCKESSYATGEEDGKRESKIGIRILLDELDEDGQDGDQRGSDSSQCETESSVLDVHVIDDKYNLGNEESGRGSNVSQVQCASEILGNGDEADESCGTITSWVGMEQYIQRSCSDMTTGGHLMTGLSDSASYVDQRRSSMSAVDSERFQLETEVEILGKRLKTIQQGRENLSFPMEYREKETFQLQLLDDIECQLQEIRKITEPGKSIRQASLPPLSSKVRKSSRASKMASKNEELRAIFTVMDSWHESTRWESKYHVAVQFWLF